jgi:hypothetical protein
MVGILLFSAAFTSPTPFPATVAGLAAHVASEPWTAQARSAAAAAKAARAAAEQTAQAEHVAVEATESTSPLGAGTRSGIGVGIGVGIGAAALGLQNLRQASVQAGSWAQAATMPLRERLSQQSNDWDQRGNQGEGGFNCGANPDGALSFQASPSLQTSLQQVQEDSDTMAFLSPVPGEHDGEEGSAVSNFVDVADEWTMSFAASLTTLGQQAADAVQNTTPRWT